MLALPPTVSIIGAAFPKVYRVATQKEGGIIQITLQVWSIDRELREQWTVELPLSQEALESLRTWLANWWTEENLLVAMYELVTTDLATFQENLRQTQEVQEPSSAEVQGAR